MLITLIDAGISGIGVHRVFLPVQQLGYLGHVRHVGGGAVHVMHQTRFDIGADVRLHPEVVLVALLRLVHFRVTLALPVLR
ncbi:hypothetical protein ALP25_200120 [Pseudomonas syringae pv. syringae]|nr:hypothetical protein ALP25_200120 [Pseudomonas syringae pv. syringae]